MTSTHRADRTIARRSLLRFGAAGAGSIAAATALSSCNTGDPVAPGESVEATGVEGVDPVQIGDEVEGILYPDPYVGPRAHVREPFYTGDKTFRIGVKLNTEVVGDWNTNEYSKWLEERTGVKVEYEVVLNTDDDLTRVNAQLTAGDMPDAYLGIPFTQDQVSLYGSQGVFQPVENLIETYAPMMRQIMSDYPDWGASMTALDGHKYQMSTPNDCYHCRVSPGRAFINQKYLDAVGAEMPETTEELREVLRLFKEQDPSGTGQMIPFACGGTDFIDDYIMNSFLYTPGSNGQGSGWLRVVDGKVDFAANKPEWREALRYLRQLNLDGTLDRTAFTMTGDELLRAGNQGRIGFVRSYYWGWFADIDYENPDAMWRDYVSIPPLAGPEGVRYARWSYDSDRSRPFVITKNCENPEVLVQWADYMMDLEGGLRGSSGNEDNWRYADEGELGINGRQAVYYGYTWPAPTGTSWASNTLSYSSNDQRLSAYVDPEKPTLEVDLYNATTVYEEFKPPQEMYLPKMIFDESAAARRADVSASVESHVRSNMAAFAIGEKDIEDDGAWDEYVSALDAMGLPDYLELHQQAFDARQG